MLIEDTIKLACSRINLPGFEKNITYEWNNRFSSTIGKASYFFNKTGLIKLSTKAWEVMSDHQKVDVILHETAHILAFHLYEDAKDDVDACHGKRWKHVAKIVGAIPNKTCNYAPSCRRKVKRITLKCDCYSGCMVTTQQFNKIKTSLHRCYKCKAYLYPVVVLDERYI